jgi:hypothetical protein
VAESQPGCRNPLVFNVRGLNLWLFLPSLQRINHAHLTIALPIRQVFRIEANGGDPAGCPIPRGFQSCRLQPLDLSPWVPSGDGDTRFLRG